MSNIKKSSFWSAEHNAYLTYIKEGKKLPEGAIEVRGNRGARYFYLPSQKVTSQDAALKTKHVTEGEILVYPIPGHDTFYLKRTGGGSRGVGAQKDSVRAVGFDNAWRNRELLNWDRMEAEGIEFPTPDNPKRLHSHKFSVAPHPVSEVHPFINQRQFHKDEVIEFDRIYNQRHHNESWLDKYNVKVKQVTVPKLDIPALAYVCEGCKPLLAFEHQGKFMVYDSAKKEMSKFGSSREALGFVKRMIEKGRMMTRINKMLIQKSEDLLTDESIYSTYKAGEDDVVMSGAAGQYKVYMNGTEVLNTDDVRQAVNKYYSEISKVLRNQTSDKDMALELLGEHVVQSHRYIRQAMAKLAQNNPTVKWMEDWDMSKITLDCFDKGFMMPPTAITGGVPLNEEMGHARDGIDMKPSRGDLKPEDYKKDKKSNKEQEPTKIETKNSLGDTIDINSKMPV